MPTTDKHTQTHSSGLFLKDTHTTDCLMLVGEFVSYQHEVAQTSNMLPNNLQPIRTCLESWVFEPFQLLAFSSSCQHCVVTLKQLIEYYRKCVQTLQEAYLLTEINHSFFWSSKVLSLAFSRQHLGFWSLTSWFFGR